MRTGRPVLAIKRDEAQLDVRRPRQRRLDSHGSRPRARTSCRRRGRSAGSRWRATAWRGSGTGWLVAPETIVTNRHVAAEFGRQSGTTFVFRKGLDGQAMRASIDLLEEIDREDSLTFELRADPAHRGLRTARISPSCASIRSVASRRRHRSRLRETSQPDDFVAVIGYPARDSRIPDVDLMDRIFGNVYDKKRLAPGQVTRAGERHHPSRLLDARRQLGIGRAVARHRRGGRPALRRQVPRGQLRGLEQRRRAAARRRAERAGDATVDRRARARKPSRTATVPTPTHRSIVGDADAISCPCRSRSRSETRTRRPAPATAPRARGRHRRGRRLGRGRRGVRRGGPGGLRRPRGIRRRRSSARISRYHCPRSRATPTTS